MTDRPGCWRKVAGAWAALALAGAIGACTTTGSGSDEAPEPGVPPPGIAFDYVLDHGATTPPMRLCWVRFMLVKGTPMTTVMARMTPTASKILVKVPAGSYRLQDAGCDNGKVFQLPKLDLITVQADRVTFLGEIRLEQSMMSRKTERDSLVLDARDTSQNRESAKELADRQLQVDWVKAPAELKAP
jgi:hypothetical protein